MEFFNRRRVQTGFEVLAHHHRSRDVRSSWWSCFGWHHSSNPNPGFGIPVEFVRRTVHSYFRQPYGGGSRPKLLLEERVFIKTSSDCFDLHASYDDSCDTIVRNLSKLGIDRVYYKQIAGEVIDLGRRVSESENCTIHVQIQVVQEHIHDETWLETRLFDRYREEEEEEDGNGRNEWGLKQKTIMKSSTTSGSDEATTTCTVCLKDLPVGSKATCMPCSHMFHRDCIVTWLNNNSSCPLCRFRLPTS